MPDRTINFGDDATEAVYQLGDADTAGGGDFLIVRNTDTSTNIFYYDATADEIVSSKTIRINGNVAATEATNVEAFATAGASGTVPVSQGDGTLAMQNISTEIDLKEYQSIFDAPDPANVTKPQIAYLQDEDDYVGVFQS